MEPIFWWLLVVAAGMARKALVVARAVTETAMELLAVILQRNHR
jgi:hypothetical protein